MVARLGLGTPPGHSRADAKNGGRFATGSRALLSDKHPVGEEAELDVRRKLMPKNIKNFTEASSQDDKLAERTERHSGAGPPISGGA